MDDDNKINSRNLKTNKIYSKSNFFKYLINTSILAVALFGVLNLTKETIIVNYPYTKPYINSLYETFSLLKALVLSLIN